MSAWQKIDYSNFPKGLVLVYADGIISTARYSNHFCTWVTDNPNYTHLFLRMFPSHWMPLPEPPIVNVKS